MIRLNFIVFLFFCIGSKSMAQVLDFDEDAEFFNFNIEENVINNTMTIDGLDLVFTGTLIFGLPNGNGTGLALKKGGGISFIYEGSWKNGRMDGYGEFTDPLRPGYYYRGGWKDGKRYGEGEIRNVDGSITKVEFVENKDYDYEAVKTNSKFSLPMEKFNYTGQVLNDLPNGWGKAEVFVFEIFWAGSYEGYWLNGYPHGFGKLWASSQGPMSGSYYVGIWFNGTMWDSEGTFQYPSGTKFKGIFNANGPVYGTITYKNGNTFTGGLTNFLEGDGFGTYTKENNGRIYSGPFKNGRWDTSEMQVNGTLYIPDEGKFYVGAWENGIPVGQHTVTLASGDVYKVCAKSTTDSYNFIDCDNTVQDDPDTCPYPDWIGDGQCDDEVNIAVCNYDGGDCCGSNPDTSLCTLCTCIEIENKEQTTTSTGGIPETTTIRI